MVRLTVGTDPEFALIKGGIPISSLPFVSGTKQHPEILPNGAGFCNDGALAEISTVPATTAEEFVESIYGPLKFLKDKLGFELSVSPLIKFSKDQLDDPECWRFGCDPDMSVWNRFARNKAPKLERDNFNRPIGGHVHFGLEYLYNLRSDGNISELARFVKITDMVVGSLSAILDSDKIGRERRSLYGKAGCVRFPDHGLEYRTPSARWIRTAETVGAMHKAMNKVVELFFDGLNPSNEDSAVEEIINNCERDRARMMLSRFLDDKIVKNVIRYSKMKTDFVVL